MPEKDEAAPKDETAPKDGASSKAPPAPKDEGAPLPAGPDEKDETAPKTEACPKDEAAPLPVGTDEVYREFAETLRLAAWVFQNEKDGRFQGSIIACRAVARFIHQKNGGVELAGPFTQIAGAFEVLEKGGKPRLFSKKGIPAKQRERSPERKHIQMLAAAALEVFVELGDELEPAAAKVARHLNKWPGMDPQDVHSNTVIAWRKQQHRMKKPEFSRIINEVMSAPNPHAEIEGLLKKGPPGLFR